MISGRAPTNSTAGSLHSHYGIHSHFFSVFLSNTCPINLAQGAETVRMCQSVPLGFNQLRFPITAVTAEAARVRVSGSLS